MDELTQGSESAHLSRVDRDADVWAGPDFRGATRGVLPQVARRERPWLDSLGTVRGRTRPYVVAWSDGVGATESWRLGEVAAARTSCWAHKTSPGGSVASVFVLGRPQPYLSLPARYAVLMGGSGVTGGVFFCCDAGV